MHREAAGIATALPTIKRVANETKLSLECYQTGGSVLTDIAPDRRPVHRVTVPDDRVDELVKAGKACPYHVETGTSVPRLQMPWERNSTEKETKECERRVDFIGVSHLEHRSLSSLSDTAARRLKSRWIS